MAEEKKMTTKKTTPKKTVAKATKSVDQMVMTPEMIEQFKAFMETQVLAQEETTTKKSKVRTRVSKGGIKQKYSNESVELSSCIHGIVSYKNPRNKMLYTWTGYGDTVELDIDDLMVMSEEFLTSPYLMITENNDEELRSDLIKLYKIEKLYDYIDIIDDIEYDVNDFDTATLKSVVDSLNGNGKTLIGDIAGKIQDAIDKGELDSTTKINELSKILGRQLFLPNN